MVSVPVRLDVVVFAATVNPVDPEPVPDAPLFTVIQVAPLAAVHPQPAVVVTVSTRIIPSVSGAGFPRLTVCSAVLPPAAKS
jgi:hypothetical protein